MILAELLLRVLRRLMLYLHLRGHRRYAPLLHHMDLCRQRACLYASSAAVEADAVVDPAIHSYIVDDNVVDIHIANYVYIHARYRRVVEKVSAVPVAAVVAMANVAVAVIHATIEADMQAPVAMMEAIEAAVESPVARRPQRAFIGRVHPAARHPVVSHRAPRPVAGSPQVVRVGSGRLIVIR